MKSLFSETGFAYMNHLNCDGEYMISKTYNQDFSIYKKHSKPY